MKWIKYQYVCNSDSNIILTKRIGYSLANISLARKEALNGSFSIEEDDKVYKKEPLPIEFGGTGENTIEGIKAAFGIKDCVYKGKCPVVEDNDNLWPPSYWAELGSGVFDVEYFRDCGLAPFESSGLLLNMFSEDSGFISQIITDDAGYIYYRSGDIVTDSWVDISFKEVNTNSAFSCHGSYDGDGWHGKSYKNSVTTKFKPRWIMVVSPYGYLFGVRTGVTKGEGYGLCRTNKDTTFIGRNVFNFGDDEVTWYVDNFISDGNIVGCQSNISMTTYYWVAGI